MEIFYVITMKTKTGKSMFLSLWEGTPKWTFDFNKSCYWDSEEVAERFAKRWFKTFKDWKVKEIKVNTQNLGH